MAPENNYLTVKELADIMSISRIAVFNKIKLGRIKAEKIGRNYIIYKKDLPEIFAPELSQKNKTDIEAGVRMVLKDYGETIRHLGKE